MVILRDKKMLRCRKCKSAWACYEELDTYTCANCGDEGFVDPYFNKMRPRYRLKKSMPGMEEGSVFRWDGNILKYRRGKTSNLISEKEILNKEWFEEISEKETFEERKEGIKKWFNDNPDLKLEHLCHILAKLKINSTGLKTKHTLCKKKGFDK